MAFPVSECFAKRHAGRSEDALIDFSYQAVIIASKFLVAVVNSIITLLVKDRIALV